MNKFIASFALSFILMGVSGQSLADTPEQVERQYVDAIRSDGMTAIPQYIHPDELKRFKEMLAPALAGETTLANSLRRAFFGPEATVASVAAMSPAEFMRGFMAFAQGQMKTMNVSVGQSEILGSVKEGEIVHLVTRNTTGAGALQLTQLEVVSLKPYQGSWRLLLSGKLEGMAQALKAQATAASP